MKGCASAPLRSTQWTVATAPRAGLTPSPRTRTQVENRGGPGVVIGVGADDVPEEQRGEGTKYLMDRILWGLRDECFEAHAQASAKSPCPRCGVRKRLYCDACIELVGDADALVPRLELPVRPGQHAPAPRAPRPATRRARASGSAFCLQLRFLKRSTKMFSCKRERKGHAISYVPISLDLVVFVRKTVVRFCARVYAQNAETSKQNMFPLLTTKPCQGESSFTCGRTAPPTAFTPPPRGPRRCQPPRACS